MRVARTKTTGDERLLAHLRVLSDDDRAEPLPPESRVSDRIGPALAALLVRALRRSGATRGARRL